MDPMELRSGKTLVETEVKGNSEDDLEEEVPTSLNGYATRGIDKERRVSSVRQEMLETAPLQPPPHPTMDIPSVRYWPALANTLADLTSARGPTHPEPLESGRVNIIINKINQVP